MDADAKRPTTSVLECAARVASLVLAGLVTLSIIGSIAAIPSGSIGTRIGFEQPQARDERLVEGEKPDPAAVTPQSAQPTTKGVEQASPGATAPELPLQDIERWLEAITYALIALAGLAALAVLLLWRGVRERRRLAEALEALAASR